MEKSKKQEYSGRILEKEGDKGKTNPLDMKTQYKCVILVMYRYTD